MSSATLFQPGHRRRPLGFNNHLTSTIVLVALVLCASLATALSFPSWRPAAQAGERAAQAGQRLAELSERALVNDFNENVVNDELAADDEEFLRHLKVAARYLDAKLLANERQQLERQRQPVLGLELAPLADEGESPRYGLLVEQPAAVPLAPNPHGRFQYSLEAPSGGAGAGDDDLPETGPALSDEADEDHDNQQAEQAEQTSNRKASLLNYLRLLDKARVSEQAAASEQQAGANAPGPQQDEAGAHLEASKRRSEPRKTTLLEAEEEEEEEAAAAAAAGEHGPAERNTSAPAPTTPSYGKLVPARETVLEGRPQQPSSAFGRLYASLSQYLPFLGQAGASIARPAQDNRSAPASEHELSGAPTTLTPGQAGGDKPREQHQRQQDKRDDLKAELRAAKQGVSATKATERAGSADKATQREDSSDDKSGARRLLIKVNVNEPEHEPEHEHEHEHDNDNGNETEEAERKSAASSASKRLSVAPSDEGEDARELDSMVAAAAADQRRQDQEASGGHLNLMRQPNLVVPLHSSDLLVRTGAQDESLMGKYIYAPTQHYYLGALPHGQQHKLMEGPGQLKQAYAFQREPASLFNFAHLMGPASEATGLSGGGGGGGGSDLKSSNDLYFLIMVGAFCVMAMAVVLAAGLFAYRVQQQRKSGQETDYPTYGVVGPNNMAGGGGAAAFVGGYFNSAPGGKSAKAKHLPDSYGLAAAAAAAALDSGLDKSLSSVSHAGSHKRSSNKSSSSTISSAGANAAAAAPAAAAAHECQQQAARNSTGATVAPAAPNQDAARMYHYQHQKQQMIISERGAGGRHTSASDLDSDEENDDGSYTVYECPGLASAHEMEIKNPLFSDDQSP